MMQFFNLEHFSLSAQPICGKLPKSNKLSKISQQCGLECATAVYFANANLFAPFSGRMNSLGTLKKTNK